ncbi:MAG TPA: DEAD/DEAH box helicase [Stenotrophobium sp.]|jgi:ATP-dependent RNA helicase DeaD|nr:DEAD/DEAH box helicase [Stenotrophobium sp.]
MSSDSIAPTQADVPHFRDLALNEAVLKALEEIGYESPSPIQAATIPHLLAGRDVLGQAQTGTGKTAAFALPILSNLKPNQSAPQALVLAPTRELAIQVAEAFQKYAAHIRGFHVLPIYGGQSYEPQLKALKRGVQVVVGTPGRVMDHMKRGTLKLNALTCLVLDEADEMLRMGFIDDVEFILQQTPPQRQVALFSATMPSEIRRIAQTHLKDPAEITIKSKTTTATNIRQRYLIAGGMTQKLDALTRILEAETFDGMLIFARTKAATAELAEKLEARGYAAAALNGDIVQAQRERTVNRLKSGQLDIVVATDVAARGLDVERISHVVNFDVPTDTESYVHRIGRTGRAGRSGDAILFIAPRERHLLKTIERATRQPITEMGLPSVQSINDHRIQRFKQRISEALAGAQDLAPYRRLVADYAKENAVAEGEVAAALAHMLHGETPLLRAPEQGSRRSEMARGPAHVESFAPRPREHQSHREMRDAQRPAPKSGDEPPRPRKPAKERDEPLETYRIEVGSAHGVKPANIVGAIANEAGLDSQYIGRVDIHEEHSFVDLPAGMPKDIYKDLQKVWVSGKQLRISRVTTPAAAAGPTQPARPRKRP